MATRDQLIQALARIDMGTDEGADYFLVKEHILETTKDEEKIPFLQRPQENIYE